MQLPSRRGTMMMPKTMPCRYGNLLILGFISTATARTLQVHFVRHFSCPVLHKAVPYLMSTSHNSLILLTVLSFARAPHKLTNCL
ncbi:hypothetical protein SCLCIDRAFT_202431 [Scleroderma citrinum Foug A]|uniref:Uncharacterized protein n=1 Tax=Scleroderma citrinum Foug A TaxID=1036808 RepID=A0A0C3DLL7_9AGAM|nr:hypothetical protein SCLCIDRAFT_202431 [Scleroderma citrinum Foug A]